MSIRRTLAVARYAFAANWRTPITWAGPAVLLGVTLLGPAVSLKNHGQWGFDETLLVAGYAFGALFALRSGLADHRIHGLDDFLRENFITPAEHMAAAFLCLAANLLAMLACMVVAGLAISLGDIGAVAWLTWMALLMTVLMLPFVLMVESASDLRTPLFVPAFAYLISMFVLVILVGFERTAGILALNADRTWPPSSLPLAGRAAFSLVVGLALVSAFTWIRSRPRQRREHHARLPSSTSGQPTDL
ncbi:MAG TPA: hypothetical protein VK966_03570 [Longimicrobiales bacterium]|nr:hypothetical protein [Longimicrobiales bacterium]